MVYSYCLQRMMIFAARCYASEALAVMRCLSVCLSVCHVHSSFIYSFMQICRAHYVERGAGDSRQLVSYYLL